MTLEELEIVVKANVDEAIKQLDELKAKMEEIQNSEETQKNFKQISNDADDMSKSVSESAGAMDSATKSAEGLAPALAQSGVSMEALTTALAEALPVIASVCAVLLVVVAVVGAIVIAIKLLIAQYKALIKLFKAVLIPTIKVFKKVLQGFARAITKEITNAISTLNNRLHKGINNLVQVSTKLNTALSSLKSSLTQTGNALATAVAPVIEAIIPLMNSLLNTVTNLANGLAQITARLFGNATMFKRAKKVNEDYAKSVAKTTNANKGMLASFDELNVINDNSNGEASVYDMFENAPIESDILDFVDKLKEAWNSNDIGTLENIGADIGANVNNQIDNLPAYEWGMKIGEKINNALAIANGFLSQNQGKSIGTKIADFILGALGTLTPEQVGRFIANVINNGIGLVWSFVKRMNAEDGWNKVGKWIADSFSEAIRSIDATELGEAISGFVSGVLTMAYRFFVETDWVEVGNKIADVLIAVDWWDVLTKLVMAIWSVWQALETVRSTIWEKIKQALWNRLDSTTQMVLTVIGSTLKGILEAILMAGLGIPGVLATIWKTITQWFDGTVAPVFTPSYWSKLLEQINLPKVFKGIFNGVIAVVESAINKIITNINKLRWDVPDWIPRNRRREFWL